MNRNGNIYYYYYNAQGDVLGLYDQFGSVVATYEYDAWGNVVNMTQTGANIGTLNPFRYRGYYYDTESGLYYLNSRYYDPVTGRFINADAVINNGLIDTNLFAYCVNNPVNLSDPSGYYAMVARGSAGSDVKTLQTALNQYGYGLAVDGIFGRKTQAAVKDYQKKHGLAVDGIVGPKTWGSLKPKTTFPYTPLTKDSLQGTLVDFGSSSIELYVSFYVSNGKITQISDYFLVNHVESYILFFMDISVVNTSISVSATNDGIRYNVSFDRALVFGIDDYGILTYTTPYINYRFSGTLYY